MVGRTPKEHQMSIFEVAFESFIDMNRELVLLSRQIDRGGDAVNTLMAAAAYNMRHWMNRHASSSFVSLLKTVVKSLGNMIFGDENKSVRRCPALAEVA